ncbi:MAG TPA: PilC/PilY family type IV pilus protein [Tahibacter sp.]|uniref:pilus assembly protein n=1 Tax=Tahibacter sp. TaxID=2056211 RepID=UPI002D13E6B1|nr:PilC/PilY family type IV pilus protein [Tahibacter sp.]HSX60402.1 PilC/PilY family type IV pilus protein [Tahibacter sp.]
MKPGNRLISPRWLGAGFALCLCAVQSQDARAWTTDLLATPPELTAAVAPNLVLTFDDSGSMGSDFMPDQRPYDPNNTGWGNPYRCAGVIDPNVTDETNPRSRSMNGVYFNPNNAYDPPIEGDLTNSPSMPTQVWPTAQRNGIAHYRNSNPNTGLGTINASTTSFCNNTGAGYYRYKTTAPNLVLDANGKITNYGDLYNSNNWEWISLTAASPALPPGVTLAQARQRFVNWYAFYRTRQMAAISAVSHAYRTFGPEVRVAWQNINSNFLAAATEIRPFELQPTAGGIRDRFYDWLFNIPASGGTPNRGALKRTGAFFQRSSGTWTNPYWDAELNKELVCRQNFHVQMTDGLWNGDSGITSPGSDTTALTLPDGVAYTVGQNYNKIMWNETGNTVETMADMAFYYWATPLRTGGVFAGAEGLRVPPYLPDKSTNLFGPPLPSGGDPLQNNEIYWNPANDPARWPHLVQFMIGFGASGTLQNDDATYAKLRGSNAVPASVAWPVPNEGVDDGRKIDDMWHAAINSRGKFFISNNPAELAQALVDIVSSITARRATATAATVSLPIVTASTEAFKASFDTSDWSGTLTKFAVDSTTGQATGSAEWDAAQLLTARTAASRNIFTWDALASPRRGIPLLWASLNSTQQGLLNDNPTTIAVDNDGLGSQRVDYLRGERARETTAPFMRRRSTLMGAIVNSQPTYVSGPIGMYQDSFPTGSPEALAAGPTGAGQTYAKFSASVRARPPTVYVGSNDGMVHAINSLNGQERFAYMPNILIANKKATEYTNPTHAQIVTGVDSRLRVQDVFIGGRWRTVMVGSMRLGGRGIFALDVTDPSGFGPANVLWEFSNTSTGGAALGYTYDSANIVRLNTGKWAVLVSSGYFPTTNPDPRGEPDPASTDVNKDKTSLFVLDLETGARIAEIQTSTAPQGVPLSFGLSTPAAYDLNSDQIDDIAVAGDLVGNLFRFDLSSSNPAQWKVDLMFKTYTTTPTQVDANSLPRQPITSMPVALRDTARNGAPIWVFGTGKYLGKEDRTATGIASNVGPQAIYGVRDYGTTSGSNVTNYPTLPSQLTQQTLTQPNATSRVLTTNAVPVSTRGWMIPLNIAAEPGERAVFTAKPIYSLNVAVVNTVIPRGSDPCNPQFRGASILVDGATGGSPAGAQQGGPCQGDQCRDPTPRLIGDKFVLPITGDPGGGGGIPVPVDDMPGIKAPPANRGSWRELLDIL